MILLFWLVHISYNGLKVVSKTVILEAVNNQNCNHDNNLFFINSYVGHISVQVQGKILCHKVFDSPRSPKVCGWKQLTNTKKENVMRKASKPTNIHQKRESKDIYRRVGEMCFVKMNLSTRFMKKACLLLNASLLIVFNQIKQRWRNKKHHFLGCSILWRNFSSHLWVWSSSPLFSNNL